jgi:hypothetical protein
MALPNSPIDNLDRIRIQQEGNPIRSIKEMEVVIEELVDDVMKRTVVPPDNQRK